MNKTENTQDNAYNKNNNNNDNDYAYDYYYIQGLNRVFYLRF